MHKNTLKINFISRQCNGWPTVNIFIDDDLYEEAHLNKESFEIEIPIQLEDRLHKLEIEHFGKTNKNTKIDSHGNIIQDLSFEIEKIEIQNLTVPEYMMRTNIFVHKFCTYKHVNFLYVQNVRTYKIQTLRAFRHPHLVSTWPPIDF